MVRFLRCLSYVLLKDEAAPLSGAEPSAWAPHRPELSFYARFFFFFFFFFFRQPSGPEKKLFQTEFVLSFRCLPQDLFFFFIYTAVVSLYFDKYTPLFARRILKVQISLLRCLPHKGLFFVQTLTGFRCYFTLI